MGHELFLTQFEAGESISAIPRRIKGHLLWVNRIFATTVLYYRKAGTTTGIPGSMLGVHRTFSRFVLELQNHASSLTHAALNCPLEKTIRYC